MTTLYLKKEDISNPLHPNMWYELLEQLFLPKNTSEIKLELASIEAVDFDEEEKK